jgi:hypothetical protein
MSIMRVSRGAIGGQLAHARRCAADRGGRGEAAGAVAEAVIRSVELMVQPDEPSVSEKESQTRSAKVLMYSGFGRPDYVNPCEKSR